jgi:hypothetical protein
VGELIAVWRRFVNLAGAGAAHPAAASGEARARESLGGAAVKKGVQLSRLKMQASPVSRKRGRSGSSAGEGEAVPCAGAVPAVPAGGALASLQGCVEALGSSVNATMARLSGSLASSVSMMQTMNAMMEDYVMRSLSAGASWDRAGLRVRVANQSRMPVAGVRVVARLVADEVAHEVAHEVSDKVSDNVADEDAPSAPPRVVLQATLEVLQATLEVLPAGDAAELPADLHASLAELDSEEARAGSRAARNTSAGPLGALLHSAVEVSLEFASPGTGQPLRVLARVPVLLWDRMSPADVADASSASLWTASQERVRMSADAARRLLWLSAYDALALPASRAASLTLPGLPDALVIVLRAERAERAKRAERREEEEGEEGEVGEVAISVHVGAAPAAGRDLRPYLGALLDDLRRFRARYGEPPGAAVAALTRYKYERASRAS